MGQNFLISRKIFQKIIEAAGLKGGDIVLEIGPGMGVLTKELAARAKKVIAVEKDKKMVEILKETLAYYKNVEIIGEDILKITDFKEEITDYKIVANIPYYLTSPLIRKFLENPPGDKHPKEMILMVQKEVAERICAKPPKMSLLAVSVQFYAEPKIIFYVPGESFFPKPKVDSAIIGILPLKNKRDIDSGLFFKIAKAGFSQKRKQLSNNLSRGLKITKEKANLWLLKNDISPGRRAETLSVYEWISLAKSYEPNI